MDSFITNIIISNLLKTISYYPKVHFPDLDSGFEMEIMNIQIPVSVLVLRNILSLHYKI